MRINESKEIERLVDETFSPQHMSLANSHEYRNLNFIKRYFKREENNKKSRRRDN